MRYVIALFVSLVVACGGGPTDSGSVDAGSGDALATYEKQQILFQCRDSLQQWYAESTRCPPSQAVCLPPGEEANPDAADIDELKEVGTWCHQWRHDVCVDCRRWLRESSCGYPDEYNEPCPTD